MTAYTQPTITRPVPRMPLMARFRVLPPRSLRTSIGRLAASIVTRYGRGRASGSRP